MPPPRAIVAQKPFFRTRLTSRVLFCMFKYIQMLEKKSPEHMENVIYNNAYLKMIKKTQYKHNYETYISNP